MAAKAACKVNLLRRQKTQCICYNMTAQHVVRGTVSSSGNTTTKHTVFDHLDAAVCVREWSEVAEPDLCHDGATIATARGKELQAGALFHCRKSMQQRS